MAKFNPDQTEPFGSSIGSICLRLLRLVAEQRFACFPRTKPTTPEPRDRLLQLLPFHHHPPEHLKLRHLGAMEYQRYQEPPVEQASLIPPNVPAIDLHLGVPSRRPVGLLPGMWVTWVLKWHMFILRIQDEPGSPKINSDCWAHKMFFIVFRCFSCISLHNVSQACSI